MSKRKIYSKLFKFASQSSWILDKNSTSKTKIYSCFFVEYTLEFISDGTVWKYKIYNGRNFNEYNIDYSGIVTFNKSGKILITIIISLISIILLRIYSINGYYPIIISFISSYLLSYFLISIFNWEIYKSFRKAKYAVYNVEKIKKKEENNKLNNRIINIVNNTIAKDLKLSRKIKLNKLNKRYFW